ncbi:cyclase family protein [Aerococcaceae bacterium DSM 111020]|nr:cyclase family protein [Aerococcaceae bacterium DSM 111020]
MNALQQLLQQLKEYRWVNLTHDITKEMPLYQAFEPLVPNVITTLEETGSDNRTYTLATSHGTHTDAPAHFMPGGRTFAEIDLKERVLPLCVVHIEEKVTEDNGYAVTVADLKEWEAEHGRFPEGCFVALSTGWYHMATDQETFENRNEEGVEVTPGWSIPALEFLSRERHVQAIGHETLNTDSGVEAAASDAPLPLPAQRFWLNENKYQVEMLKNLDLLPATGSIIFVTLPHVKGAPAFPSEVWAIVPKE